MKKMIKFLCIEYIIANALIYSYDQTNGNKIFVTKTDISNIIYKLKQFYEERYKQQLVIISSAYIENEIHDYLDHLQYDMPAENFYFLDIERLKDRYEVSPNLYRNIFSRCFDVINLTDINVTKSETFEKFSKEDFLGYCYDFQFEGEVAKK